MATAFSMLGLYLAQTMDDGWKLILMAVLLALAIWQD